MLRYIRNIGTLSPDEQAKLQKARICVVGCGALGGYSIEMLARLGVGHLTVVDGDSLEESNLNRQILADKLSLGKNKAAAARSRIELVNPLVTVNAVERNLTAENARDVIEGHDVLVDALDDISARFLLQSAAEELGVVMVHAGVETWYGQVCTIFPGDRTLDRVYANQSSLKREYPAASFIPPLIAAVQVGEVVKVLVGRGTLLRRKVLHIDLLEHEYHIVQLYPWQQL